MKVAVPSDVIDVEALRVGMFVHLDVGWMAHPFPLSSFRIASPAQVATIRSLGLKRVRWSPQQSDLSAEAVRASSVAPPAGPLGRARVEAANDAVNDIRSDIDDVDADADSTDTEPVAPDLADRNDGAAGGAHPAEANGTEHLLDGIAGVVSSPAEAALDARVAAERERVRRRRALVRQRAAEAQSERQYGEAARDCRQTIELVATRPQEARLRAETLTRAVLDKMLAEPDLCIRTMTAGAGDRTSMHALNVGVIALLMGRGFGFAAEDMLDLGVGALLHDVGKLDLPARLRHREDNFSAGELLVYEEHVELGLVHARRMGLTPGAMAVIAQHHEHADASGFPAALNSDRMTMAGRIVALVNRYDNLCNPHLLAKALTPHESLSLLFAQGRAKFDTSILGAFIKMMGVYPPGSAVQLTDDRYALVAAVNPARPLKPKVVVHDAATPRAEALVLDLQGVPGLGIRRSVKLGQLPPAAAEYLAPSAQIAYFFEPAAPAGEEDDDTLA